MTRTTLVGFVLLFGASGCGGPSSSVSPWTATPVGPRQLDAPWLLTPNVLTQDSFDRLVAIASSDPAGASVVARAEQLVRAHTASELIALVSLCGDTGFDAQGLTTLTSSCIAIGIPLDQAISEEKRSRAIEEHIVRIAADPQILRVTIDPPEGPPHPDYATASAWKKPVICLAPEATTAVAVEALVHELTHAVDGDPTAAPSASRYADPHRYALDYLLAPGGEVDAFSVAEGVRARLEGSARGLSPVLRPFFSPAGEMTQNREALAEVILAPRPAGLGYSQSIYRTLYGDALATEVQCLDQKVRVIGQMIEARQEEARVFEHNLGAATHNLTVYAQRLAYAKSRGKKAEIEKAEAELAAGKEAHLTQGRMLKAAGASLDRLGPDRDAASRELQRVIEMRKTHEATGRGGS